MAGLVSLEIFELKTGNGKPIHQFKRIAEAVELIAAGRAKPSTPAEKAKIEAATTAATDVE